jgi:hypothetical protein
MSDTFCLRKMSTVARRGRPLPQKPMLAPRRTIFGLRTSSGLVTADAAVCWSLAADRLGAKSIRFAVRAGAASREVALAAGETVAPALEAVVPTATSAPWRDAARRRDNVARRENYYSGDNGEYSSPGHSPTCSVSARVRLTPVLSDRVP